MPLIALGINHRTAPVEIRERVAFPPEELEAALRALHGVDSVREAAILSTCNRTELYCLLESGDGGGPVVDWLCDYHHLPAEQLRPYVYHHLDLEAVRHMLRVASGLDSMVLGEPQILGQMKTAFQAASRAGTVDRLLNRLFQHTFSVAKQVRTDTSIGASPVSVAFAAVSLARQIFGDLEQQTALLIGAGETIELAARHLHEQQLGRMIIANRTLERAHGLASEFNAYAIALADIPGHLAEADIIIASTASQEPLLHKAEVKQALKARKHRPMFMVDIAVPRDIDPAVAELDDVYLYTVDDLQAVIEENLRSRQEAALQAEEIVEVQSAHFMGWLRSLDAVSTIRALRGQAERHRQAVLDKARQQLTQGKDPLQVLEFLAHTLTNKLVHAPSDSLRQAGYDGRPELIEAARELFDLDRDE
ncbi:glutamyl-tRNA reductase [Thiohalobacter sp. IOR34]|uniref:glutamyl-tRNA reductase n=1 Tax=Thiohalobacter sp. IOR34 TaxID=3057176 RepID=UPI0025AEF2EC|nr:glutamyl-tRNA reductase [Thiohalobacter sp. IOR34]WJW75946.1 glutamyl-tRNA reductase [Thiohalobacter sp. IOR34]